MDLLSLVCLSKHTSEFTKETIVLPAKLTNICWPFQGVYGVISAPACPFQGTYLRCVIQKTDISCWTVDTSIIYLVSVLSTLTKYSRLSLFVKQYLLDWKKSLSIRRLTVEILLYVVVLLFSYSIQFFFFSIWNKPQLEVIIKCILWGKRERGVSHLRVV